MNGWPWLVVGLVVIVSSCGLPVLLASRLPGRILKNLVVFLPACATAARRLHTDPRMPRRAKLAVGLALIWGLLPIDLVPEFLPAIGPLDAWSSWRSSSDMPHARSHDRYFSRPGLPIPL